MTFTFLYVWVFILTYITFQKFAIMQRNDSSSVISSLQMDYGDSDEEENDSRNESHTEETLAFEMKEVKSVEMPEPDVTDNESKVDSAEEKMEVKEEAAPSPVDFISDDEEDGHSSKKHHHHNHHHGHHHQKHHKDDKVTDELKSSKEEAVSEALYEDSPASQGSQKPEQRGESVIKDICWALA